MRGGIKEKPADQPAGLIIQRVARHGLVIDGLRHEFPAALFPPMPSYEALENFVGQAGGKAGFIHAFPFVVSGSPELIDFHIVNATPDIPVGMEAHKRIQIFLRRRSIWFCFSFLTDLRARRWMTYRRPIRLKRISSLARVHVPAGGSAYYP